MENEKILSNEELLDIAGGSFIKKHIGKPFPILKYGIPVYPEYAVSITRGGKKPLYGIFPKTEEI